MHGFLEKTCLECFLRKGISACKELQFVDASFNLIESLDRSLTGMRQLHTLRLSANKLVDLRGVSLAVNLVELHAASNRIAEFGRALRDNIKLQKLNVASNRFSSFGTFSSPITFTIVVSLLGSCVHVCASQCEELK